MECIAGNRFCILESLNHENFPKTNYSVLYINTYILFFKSRNAFFLSSCVVDWLIYFEDFIHYILRSSIDNNHTKDVFTMINTKQI